MLNRREAYIDFFSSPLELNMEHLAFFHTWVSWFFARTNMYCVSHLHQGQTLLINLALISQPQTPHQQLHPMWPLPSWVNARHPIYFQPSLYILRLTSTYRTHKTPDCTSGLACSSSFVIYFATDLIDSRYTVSNLSRDLTESKMKEKETKKERKANVSVILGKLILSEGKAYVYPRW